MSYYRKTNRSVVPNLINESGNRNLGDVDYDYVDYEYDNDYNCCMVNNGCQQDPSFVLNFIVLYIVSSIRCAAKNLDRNLVDPWGIIINGDMTYIACAGSGLITTYNDCGNALCPTINVFGPHNNIAQPTSIVLNYEINTFLLYSGSVVEPSEIIICTRDGTINGYNSMIDPDNTVIVVDNSVKNSVYTGMALVANILYVADFYNHKIDSFNDNFVPITNFLFVDEFSANPIPQDYAPYNIINIGELLYVTYAKQNPRDNQYELLGRGFGYVSVFTLRGKFVRRLISNSVLNAPWGLVLAPSHFGYVAGSFIVSNYGDGAINIFNADGIYTSTMSDATGNGLCIHGIRALIDDPNDSGSLCWTSSVNNRRDGFAGTIGTNNLK